MLITGTPGSRSCPSVMTSTLTASERSRALSATYNRSAALVSPGVSEIPRRNYVCTTSAKVQLPTNGSPPRFVLGGPIRFQRSAGNMTAPKSRTHQRPSWSHAGAIEGGPSCWPNTLPVFRLMRCILAQAEQGTTSYSFSETSGSSSNWCGMLKPVAGHWKWAIVRI